MRLHVHVDGRGLGAAAVDRGGGGVDDRFAPFAAGALDRVDEPLDVDAAAALGVALVHVPRGERGEVEDDVDVGGEVVVEDGGLDELYIVVEVLGRPEVGIVDGDHVVVGREAVGEVRADEPGAARNEDAFVLHRYVSSEEGNYGFGSVARTN